MLLCPDDNRFVFGFFGMSYLSAYLFQILTYGLSKNTEGISIYFLALKFFHQAFSFVFNIITADFMVQIVCHDGDFMVHDHDVLTISLGYTQNLFVLFEACVFILFNKEKSHRKYPLDMIMIIGAFILGGVFAVACSSIIFAGFSDYNIYYYVAIAISIVSSLKYLFQMAHTLSFGKLGTLSLVFLLSSTELNIYLMLSSFNMQNGDGIYSWDLLVWYCSVLSGSVTGTMFLIAAWMFFKNQTIFKNNMMSLSDNNSSIWLMMLLNSFLNVKGVRQPCQMLFSLVLLSDWYLIQEVMQSSEGVSRIVWEWSHSTWPWSSFVNYEKRFVFHVWKGKVWKLIDDKV